MTTNFGGVDVVPLQGAIVACYGWVPGSGRGAMAPYTAMASRKSIQKNCLELLGDVTLFSTLITQNLVFAIWGLCHNLKQLGSTPTV